MWVYCVSPECVLENHTKQEIDSDGYQLWKCGFGDLETRQPISEIANLLFRRYQGVLINAATVRQLFSRYKYDLISCRLFFLKRLDYPDPGVTVRNVLDDECVASIEKALRGQKFYIKNSPADRDDLSADELMSGILHEGDKNKEQSRIWNWFRHICDAIDIQHSKLVC